MVARILVNDWPAEHVGNFPWMLSAGMSSVSIPSVSPPASPVPEAEGMASVAVEATGEPCEGGTVEVFAQVGPGEHIDLVVRFFGVVYDGGDAATLPGNPVGSAPEPTEVDAADEAVPANDGRRFGMGGRNTDSSTTARARRTS